MMEQTNTENNLESDAIVAEKKRKQKPKAATTTIKSKTGTTAKTKPRVGKKKTSTTAIKNYPDVKSILLFLFMFAIIFFANMCADVLFSSSEYSNSEYNHSTQRGVFQSKQDVLNALTTIYTDFGPVDIYGSQAIYCGRELVGYVYVNSFNSNEASITISLETCGTTLDYRYKVWPDGSYVKQ